MIITVTFKALEEVINFSKMLQIEEKKVITAFNLIIDEFPEMEGIRYHVEANSKNIAIYITANNSENRFYLCTETDYSQKLLFSAMKSNLKEEV